MRKETDPQLPLQFRQVNWGRESQLEKIDEILCGLDRVYQSAQRDLNAAVRTKAGAEGLTAEQVVRIAILKQLKQYSYEELTDRISDSDRFRVFTRLFDKKVPAPSTLQENIKKLSDRTWKHIQKALLKFAKDEGVEDGKACRTDTTAVETNIHHPTDSSLLWDCIRVLTRLMCFVQANIAGSWEVHNHTRRAKKLRFRIENAKTQSKRVPLYRELLALADKTLGYAQSMLEQLQNLHTTCFEQQLLVKTLSDEIQQYVGSTQQVIDQCRRRVIEGEAVPAQDKIVSIFETHTDIIEKGNRETIFGHKICINGGRSNMILDCLIERGNPADSCLFATVLDNHMELYGYAPDDVTADHAFRSEANARYARDKGVKNICFTTQAKVAITKWVQSLRVFKKLRDFRAGIEGCVSTMKRVLGLDRCTWSGFESFCSYVWSCIVCFNLRVLADHLLA